MIKNFIPTINISSIIKKNQDKKKIYLTIKKIEKACIDVGFFQIIGHGINQKQIKVMTSIFIIPVILCDIETKDEMCHL